jgi:hypothetical protein
MEKAKQRKLERAATEEADDEKARLLSENKDD